MGLMFAVGTMGLFWMAGLTVFILGEKLAAGLPWVWRGGGIMLAGAGAALLLV